MKIDTEDMKVVFTGNKHNEILIFQNHDDAYEWLSKATRLSHEEKEKEIRDCITFDKSFFMCFPKQEVI